MRRESFPVTGMSCDSCEQTLEKALQHLEGVTRVTADHETDTVEVVVEGGVTATELHRAIETAGYDIAV